MKKCCRCKKEKNIEDFPKRKDSPDGRKYYCKSCASIERHKAWVEKDSKTEYSKAEIDPLYWRKRFLRIKYGLTLEQLDNLKKAQDYKCAICKTSTPGGLYEGLHVDHDHKTKKVRGLLCMHCNQALGKFKDSVELLKSAISYLTK